MESSHRNTVTTGREVYTNGGVVQLDKESRLAKGIKRRKWKVMIS